MARTAGIEAREANPDAALLEHTVVLLGASNLTRGISTVVETAHNVVGQPLRLIAAMGHGRSYGQPSSVLGRWLPGITECELWRAIEASPTRQIFALVTDIGNDILYQVPIETIVSWVENCLQRLSQLDARIVMTQLPVANLESLSPTRFRFFRRIFFPSCGYSLSKVSDLVHQLNDQVAQVGASYGANMVELEPHWHGCDPIHLKMRQWQQAWQKILKPWGRAKDESAVARGSLRRWVYLRSRRPNSQKIFGVALRSKQPCGRLPNRSTIAMY